MSFIVGISVKKPKENKNKYVLNIFNLNYLIIGRARIFFQGSRLWYTPIFLNNA